MSMMTRMGSAAAGRMRSAATPLALPQAWMNLRSTISAAVPTSLPLALSAREGQWHSIACAARETVLVTLQSVARCALLGPWERARISRQAPCLRHPRTLHHGNVVVIA
jgi:hypothetical protein